MSGMRGGKRFLGGLIAWVALAALAPALAAAASIAGTVTDEDTHAGIAGIEVCAGPTPSTEIDCEKTVAGGTYLLEGLPAGSYQVRFSAIAWEPNYVQEWYGGDQIYPGDLVAVEATEAKTGIDAELEEGGVIEGTATDAETSAPAANVWVCVEAELPVFFGLCQRTDSEGKYVTGDLPTGEYRISFDGENDANYLRRYYDDTDYYGAATEVPVTAGSTVPEIDAALYPGAQIFGTVTEAGSGVPLSGIEVCLWRKKNWMWPEEVQNCTKTDPSGNYAIRSLPADAYGVVFSREGSAWVFDTFDEQWWNGYDTAEESTTVHVTPPQALTGVDAELVNHAPKPETGGGGTVTPPPSSLPSPPPPVVKQPPRKCKKGFHRKLVKGKKRCVRKHKKHQQRRKGGGVRGR